jgi:hypothetical protein
MADDTFKKNAKLAYRFFDLPEAVRNGQYMEFARLWDSGRYHEAELMLERLEKAAKK